MLKRMIMCALLISVAVAWPGCKKAQPKSEPEKALDTTAQEADKTGMELQKKLDEALKK